MKAAHVLPAHLGGLAHRIGGVGLPLRGGAVALHDLIAALAVHLVGVDVDGEELHLVIGEAVVRAERREIALVDAGDLGLEPHQESGRRQMEGLPGRLVAPGGEPAGAGKLARALDLGAAHPAGLAEADEEVHVLGAGFLLDDVLEQEVARVRIRAVAVDGGAPPRELRHVLVVLADPGAELGAGQLAIDPLLGEGIDAAMAGIHGVLELGAERARAAHGGSPLGHSVAATAGPTIRIRPRPSQAGLSTLGLTLRNMITQRSVPRLRTSWGTAAGNLTMAPAGTTTSCPSMLMFARPSRT